MKYFYILFIFSLLSASITKAQNPYTEQNLLGKQALKMNNRGAAEDYFYQSILRNKDSDSYYQLAKLLITEKDSKKKNQGYEYASKAYLLEPDNLEIKYLYLDYLEYFGKKSSRMEGYWDIFRKDPLQAMALFKIADIKLAEYEKHRALSVDTERWFLDDDVMPFDLTPTVQAELDSAEILYQKGLEIDPKSHYGLFGMARLYQMTTKPEKAIDYLKEILKYYPDDKDAHLQLGVYYYKKKKLDESFREFQNAMPLMSPEEQDDFIYNSVITLLEPKYFEPFRTMNYQQKRNLIEKWWKASDPLYFSEYNERLMEHYARVGYANLFFSVPNIDVVGWKTDRGQVLIRYGEPARKEKFKQRQNLSTDVRGLGLTQSSVTSESAIVDPNAARFGAVPAVINPVAIPGTFIEIWEYDNIPGFVFSGDVNYYKFVTGNEMEELLRKRNAPRSRTAGSVMPDSRNAINSLRDFETLKRQKMQSYKPVLYGNKLNSEFRLYQFNQLPVNNNGNAELFISYQIPARDSLGNFVKDYSHEIGIFLFDQNFDPIMQIRDTLQHSAIKRDFKGIDNPVSSIGVSTKPRKISFAFDLKRFCDSNYFSYRKAFEIAPVPKERLAISDLVFTDKIEMETPAPGSIVRGDYSFYPRLSNRFSNGEQFYIYYEVYNLSLDDKKEGDYEQVITIKPKGEEDTVLRKIVKGITTILSGEEGKISLTANYKTFEANTQVYLQLDLSEYKSGKYELTITINDKVSGTSSVRNTELEIF